MKIKHIELETLHDNTLVTLEYIHDMLHVKQHINVYRKNSNKKYGKNFEADEVLPNEIKDIIVVNTLGKLNLLNEQAYYIRLMKKTQVNTQKAQKAQDFAEKSNLADKIAEMALALTKATVYDDNGTIWEIVKKRNVPNVKYFGNDNYIDWFNDNLQYLIGLYQTGKSE